MISGFVGLDEMIYYRIYVGGSETDDKLMVSLSSLDSGDADLFLNRHESRLPTTKEHDFRSQDVIGDFIVIDPSQFPETATNRSIDGYYIIGVFGTSASKFRLECLTAKDSVQRISGDEVLEQTLDRDQTAYFIYQKRAAGDLSVVSSLTAGALGDLLLFAKEFKPNSTAIKTFLRDLPDPNNADYNSRKSNYKKALTIPDKNHCAECLYVIGVQSSKKITFSLAVHVEGGSVMLRNNKQQQFFLLKGKTQKIKVFSYDDFNVFVTATTGQCLTLKVMHG